MLTEENLSILISSQFKWEIIDLFIDSNEKLDKICDICNSDLGFEKSLDNFSNLVISYILFDLFLPENVFLIENRLLQVPFVIKSVVDYKEYNYQLIPLFQMLYAHLCLNNRDIELKITKYIFENIQNNNTSPEFLEYIHKLLLTMNLWNNKTEIESKILVRIWYKIISIKRMELKSYLKKNFDVINYYLINPIIFGTVKSVSSLIIYLFLMSNIVMAGSFIETPNIHDELIALTNIAVVAVNDEGLLAIDQAINQALEMERAARINLFLERMLLFVVFNIAVYLLAHYGVATWDFVSDTVRHLTNTGIQIIPHLARESVRNRAHKVIIGHLTDPETLKFLRERFIEIIAQADIHHP